MIINIIDSSRANKIIPTYKSLNISLITDKNVTINEVSYSLSLSSIETVSKVEIQKLPKTSFSVKKQ
jgi:hypothetical protein